MWYQLSIQNCPQEALEALSDFLETQGALSIMLTDKNDDPILEPPLGTTPLWPEVILQALFNEQEKAQSIKQELEIQLPDFQYTLEVLPEKQWETVWMDNFKPMLFGKKLWIVPEGMQVPEDDAVHLMLNPGLAFGTGTHPTTALCLHYLAAFPPQHQRVLDFGCGSGILGLAALKLGADKVLAVDIDPQALQATAQNAINNQLPSEHILCATPDNVQGHFDLILANILLKPLIDLQTQFHQWLNPSGKLVVSGLMKDQIPLMQAAYEPLYVHEKTEIFEDWALMIFSKG